MTTIVAVKSGGRIAMAADRRVCWEGHTDPGAAISKIFRLPGGGAIGFAGHEIVQQLFEMFVGDDRLDLAHLDSRRKIFETFVRFWKWARTEGTIVRDMPDSATHVAAQVTGNFIVAVPAGIFFVSSDLAVTEHAGGYWAIGSGCDYALGVLHAVWTDNGKAAPLAVAAVEAAAHFSIETGPDIEVDDWAAA